MNYKISIIKKFVNTQLLLLIDEPINRVRNVNGKN